MIKIDSTSRSKDSNSDNEVNPSYEDLFNKYKEMLEKFEKLAIGRN